MLENIDIGSALVGGATALGAVALGFTIAKKKVVDLGHAVRDTIPGHVFEPRLAELCIAFANAVNDNDKQEINNTAAGFANFVNKHVDIDEKGKLKIK